MSVTKLGYFKFPSNLVFLSPSYLDKPAHCKMSDEKIDVIKDVFESRVLEDEQQLDDGDHWFDRTDLDEEENKVRLILTVHSLVLLSLSKTLINTSKYIQRMRKSASHPIARCNEVISLLMQ